jgi:hypothetical protein
MPLLADQLQYLALGGLARLPRDIGRMAMLTKLILHDTAGHGFGLPATFTMLARLQVGARGLTCNVHAGSMLWKHAAACSAARSLQHGCAGISWPLQELSIRNNCFVSTKWEEGASEAEMLWPPSPGDPHLHLEGNEDGGWPVGGAGAEQPPADSDSEEEWVGGSDEDDDADEAEEVEEAEESAAMASLRLLHRMPALRGLLLDGCSLSNLAWLQVCPACCGLPWRNGCAKCWGQTPVSGHCHQRISARINLRN